MKWLDGRGLRSAALTSALALFLMPMSAPAQGSPSPGAYAGDSDAPPYMAPKPKPLRRSYVEPAAPPEAASPSPARKAKKAKRAAFAPAAQAPEPRRSAKPRLASQPKPKPKAVKAPSRAAKPPRLAKPKQYKAAPAPQPRRAKAEAGGASSLKAVQQALNRAGYPAPHDGKLGKSTRRALRHFQRDHRLPVTGLADRPTLIKLGLN